MAAGRRPTPSPRVATPLILSLAIHGGLFAALAMITWSLVHVPEAPETELSLDLDSPRRTEPQTSPPQSGVSGPRPAPAVDDPEIAPPANPAWMDPPVGLPVLPPASPGSPEAQRPLDAAGVEFAGVRAREVQSVVFVIDASGPSASCLPLIADELRRALARLGPPQQFQVIIARDETAFAPASPRAAACPLAPGLLPAEAASKAGAVDWLRRVRPSGRPDPILGLEMALALKPDVVYLLSRSIARTETVDWPREMESMLARLAALNPPVSGGAPRTLIRAVQFIDEDPTGLMPEIARRHGGIEGYALRTLDDLAQGEARQAASIDLERRVDRAFAALAEVSANGAFARAMVLGGSGDSAVQAEAQALRAAAATAMRDLAGAPDDAWTQIVRARAALARAAGERGPARDAALADARAALVGVESRSAGVRWMRDLALAWASASTPVPEPLADAPAAFAGEARVLAIARAGDFDPDQPLGADADPAFDLLAREVACARLVVGALEGTRAWRDVDRPWSGWLAPDAPPLGGMTPEQSRAWVLGRLGEALPEDAPASELSPEAHFALGLRLARAGAGTSGERSVREERSAEGERVLRDLLARDDGEAYHADAMLALGLMLVEHPRLVKRVQGVEWLVTRADDMPEAPGEWGRAREAASRLAAEAGEDLGARRMALGALESVLARGLASEALGGRSAWREAYAEVLIELAPLSEPMMAISLLERVPEESPHAAEAAERYGALVWPEVERLRASIVELPRGEGRDAAREQLVQRLARAIDFFKRMGAAGPLARARLACAGVVREDRPDIAADLYQSVIESGEVPAEGLPALRIARGECLRDAGQRERAWDVIAPDLDAEPSEGAFWQAWALALEIQRDENGGGTRTDAILDRIKTLRAIDPALGGEVTRGRIEEVERRPQS